MLQQRARPQVRSGDAVYVIDRHQRIVEWNEQATRLLGFRAEEALGRRCWQLLLGTDPFGVCYCTHECSIHRHLLSGHDVASRPMLLRHKSGHLIPVDMSTVFVPSAQFAPHDTIVHVLRSRPAEHSRCQLMRVFMLGPLEILRPDGGRVQGAIWQREKVRTLLALLLSAPGQMTTRESLIEALWPEMEYAAALRNLNTTVHMLRCSLGVDGKPPQPPMIVHAGGHYALSSDVVLWCDTDAFEHGLRRAAGASTPLRSLTLYTETLQLYRGDYLSDLRCTPAWSAGCHFRYQEMAVSALEDMGVLYERTNQLREAEQCYHRALELDLYCESALQKLMLLLVTCGRRATARQICLRTRAALESELDMKPSETTRALCCTLAE